jgi:hypothetical protein
MSVYAALTTQLKTVTTLPKFAEQNEVYQPGRNAWCRATLLPAEPTPGAIGAGGFDWENGLYQVDIFTPLNSPVNDTLPKAVEAAFPRALRLQVEGYDYDLEVQRCWLSANRQDTAWHIQSITVRWLVARNLGA